LRGQVVATLWEGDLQLPCRRPVELRRPARSGPDPAAEPSVFDVEQPLFKELVEVKGGQLAGDADGSGRLFPTDCLRLTVNVGIQGPPHRLVEGGDRRDL
jgi:hypothetical protein